MANDTPSGIHHHTELLINDVWFHPYVLLKLQIIYISDSGVIYLH